MSVTLGEEHGMMAFKKKDDDAVEVVEAEVVEAEVVVEEAAPAEESVAAPTERGNEYGDSPQDPPIKAQGQQTVL